MKNLSRRQRNNLIIGGLCAIVVLMGIGYAAFASQLKINGTSSISSNFSVLITDITSGSIVGGASNAEEPTHTATTATFKTNLVSPGDSITYTIKVENQGSIDATLTSIDVNTGDNEAIEFETSGIEEGDNLLQGESDELYVKVTYSDSVTSQPENTESTITVTLNYEQATGGSVPGGDTTNIGGQDVEVVTSGDGLYEDGYEEGRYVYKGENPNNYIDIGERNEDGSVALWRIISKESDGTYKVIKDGILSNTPLWDEAGVRNANAGTYCQDTSRDGCNAWGITDNFTNSLNTGNVLKNSTLNDYLNTTYYDSLSNEVKENIEYHEWYFGYVAYQNDDLKSQIEIENSVSQKNYVGLISVSDYLRANYNSNCESYKKNDDNHSTCKETNWIYDVINNRGTYLWTINASNYTSNGQHFTSRIFASSTSSAAGQITNVEPCASGSAAGSVAPVFYLTSSITLSGTGTSDDPYVIS